jgi:hypothetical protein
MNRTSKLLNLLEVYHIFGAKDIKIQNLYQEAGKPADGKKRKKTAAWGKV